MPRSRISQLSASALRFVVYGVLVVFGLLLLVCAVLAVPRTREVALRQGLLFANQQLPDYTFELTSLDSLSPFGLTLRGLSIRDHEKRQILRVESLSLGLAPFALLRETLHITSLELHGVRAHVYPSETAESAAESTSASTFKVRVDALELREAALEMELSGRALEVVLYTLHASGEWSTRPAVTLTALKADATLDRERVLQLASGSGAWRAEVGGAVALTGSLLDAELALAADVPALTKLTPWPVQKASLQLTGLTAQGLQRLGLAGGAGLKGELGIDLTVLRDASDPAALELKAQLSSGALSLILEARLREQLASLVLVLPEVELSSLSSLLPELRVGATLQASADLSASPMTAGLSWRQVRIDRGSVPDGEAKLALPLPRVKLEQLRLVGFERALAISGEYDTEHGDASVELDLNDLRLSAISLLRAQGLSGSVDGGLRVTLKGEKLGGSGALTLRDIAHPAFSFDHAWLAFHLSGKPTAPEGKIDLTMQSLRVAESLVEQAALNAEVSAHALSGTLKLLGPKTSVEVELHGIRRADGSLRAQAQGQGRWSDKRVLFVLRDFESNGRGLSLSELRLTSGGQSLWATGWLRKNQQLAAELRFEQVDLQTWAALAKEQVLTGTLGGRLTLAGKLSAPVFELTLKGIGLRYQSQPALDMTLDAQGDLDAGEAAFTLGLKSGTLLEARAEASVALPAQRRDLSRALRNARYTVALDLKGDLAQGLALQDEFSVPPIMGHLHLYTEAEGTLSSPHAQLRVNLALGAPEQGSVTDTLELVGSLDAAQVGLEATLTDPLGPWLGFTGALSIPSGSLQTALLEGADWERAEFTAEAELKPRVLDQMTGVFSGVLALYTQPLPLTAEALLEASGTLAAPVGALRAGIRLRDQGLDERCAAGEETRLTLDAQLSPQAFSASLSARRKDGSQADGRLDAQLVGNLLRQKLAAFGAASITLEGTELALASLPFMCGLSQGSARFQLSGEGLGTSLPRVRLSLSVDELSAPSAPPLSLSLKASNDENSASIDGKLKVQGESTGSFTAKLPLRYTASGVPEFVQTQPLNARLHFKNLPLENVLSFTSAIGRPSGRLDANLTLGGTLENPVPGGFVDIHDAGFTIASLAQPLRDVNGRFALKGQKLTITDVRAKDRDGELKLEGYASLFSNGRGDGGIFVEAKKFPLRQQGSVVGQLTTRVQVSAQLAEDKQVSVTARILEGRVWLTGERGVDVQPLEAHPHVRMAEDLERANSAPETSGETEQTYGLRRLALTSERDVWLMHEDFSVQVGVDLELEREPQGMKLSGEAALRRGELALLGKPFRLEKGAIRFTGDIPADPELDLKARHDLRTGEALLVHVTGRASAPQLAFSGAATNAGEAAYVLSGARSKSNASNQAQNDAAAFAASVTAGLLSVAARREFGDWVPMITIENDERTGSPGRARAGFDASNLIPPWLSGFARGAYVEGIVGSGESSGSKRMGLGVRLELSLPRDFITSMGYGPGATWSTDVAWAP